MASSTFRAFVINELLYTSVNLNDDFINDFICFWVIIDPFFHRRTGLFIFILECFIKNESNNTITNYLLIHHICSKILLQKET